MGRFVLVVLVVVGIGYGGWSLLGGDPSEPPLSSAQGETDTGGAGDGAKTAAKAAPVVASGVPEDELRQVLSEADAAVEAARVAGSRTESLKEKDRARRLLSSVLFSTRDENRSAELRRRIEALNEDVLFSEEPLPGRAFLHSFRATDRLWTLCHKTWPREHQIHIEPGFVLWVNGLSDARFIREGQVIKVPTEELALLVSKSRYRLWVLLGGVYVREFVVGVGVDDKTPEGEFEIDTKLEKPAWYSEGRKIPYGSPDNPLGTRWMGFKRTPRAAGYGIHGTSEPGSVGKAVSQGCIRMENADVEELFQWVAAGTKVRIVR